MEQTASPLPSYQSLLDQLTAFASSEERKPDLIQAKAEYFQLTGEVFEEDPVFEMRMASFLDYHLYDRRSPTTKKTPAEEFCAQLYQKNPELARAARGFCETVHGVFEVKKIAKQQVRLRDLFLGKDYEVTERRQLAGLKVGDVLEARLIPYGGHLLFSAAFCFHPPEANKAIVKEAKRRRKQQPGASPKEFIWDCSRRALKAIRYKQIPVERLYDFEHKTL